MLFDFDYELCLYCEFHDLKLCGRNRILYLTDIYDLYLRFFVWVWTGLYRAMVWAWCI